MSFDSWKPSSKETTQYNESGLFMQRMTFRANVYDEYPILKLSSILEYERDAEGLKTKLTIKDFENNQLTSDYSVDYFYNSSKTQIIETIIKWGQNGAAPSNYYKRNYTYDSEGRQTNLTYSEWVDNQWEFDNRQLNTFDQFGRDSIYESQFFGESGWENGTKKIYTHNDDTLVETLNLSWSNDQWLTNSRYQYEYNSALSKTQEVYSRWIDSTQSWHDQLITNWEYDVNQNQIQSSTEEWYSTFNGFRHERLENRYYTNNVLDSTVIHGHSRANSSMDFNTHRKETYFYPLLLGINEMEKEVGLIIYPNPIQDLLKLQYNQSKRKIQNIHIYDINGTFIETIYNPDNEINISHLNTGTYLIQFVFDGGAITKKITKL